MRVQVWARFKKSKIDAGEAAGAVQKIRFGAGAGAVAVKKKIEQVRLRVRSIVKLNR